MKEEHVIVTVVVSALIFFTTIIYLSHQMDMAQIECIKTKPRIECVGSK